MSNYIVVGGSKGIGLDLVQKLLNDQHHVWVLARTSESLFESPNLTFIPTDVTDLSLDVQLLPEQIDGFVYCPGSINLKPFNRLSMDDFNLDWQINVLSGIKLLQMVLPNLKKSEHASVVFYSTVAVSMGMPFHASVAASKGAIEGLVKSLSAEFAPKIRVNAVAPSLTQTPLSDKLTNTPEKIEASAKRHPLQRIGTASDIAEITKFLLYPSSSWITGQIIHVDGGMSSIKM